MKKFSKKNKNRIIQMVVVSLISILIGAIMLGVGLNKNVVLDLEGRTVGQTAHVQFKGSIQEFSNESGDVQVRAQLPTGGYTPWIDARLKENNLNIFPSNAYAWMTQSAKTVSLPSFGVKENVTLQKSSEARNMGLVASIGSFIFYALIIYLIIFGTITIKSINAEKNKNA